jgi:hypothetical protein
MKAARKIVCVVAATISLLTSGCGGMTQTYEGPKKAAGDVAILRTNVGELTFQTAWIDRVDDKNLVRAYSEIELLPGPHSVRIQLSSGFLRASRTVAFEAKGGHTYRVKGLMGRAGTSAWLEDAATGEIVAGEAS